MKSQSTNINIPVESMSPMVDGVLACADFAAGRCRSCRWLAQPYAEQLQLKQAQVAQQLPMVNIPWLPPVASVPYGFRNKAKMVVSGSVAEPCLGIVDSAGLGVDLAACPLYPHEIKAAFEPLREFIRRMKLAPYEIQTRRGELKYLLLTASPDHELMLRFVLRSPSLVERIRKGLPQLLVDLPGLRVVTANLQPIHQAILEGEREILLTAAESIAMRVNGIPLHLRPRSFFQTNTAVASELYQQAQAWIQTLAPRRVWDLFCGVGGFALHSARVAEQVTGIEISNEAIDSARATAEQLGLGNVQFRALGADDFTDQQNSAPELIIVNPPRRGLGAALCEYLNRSEAQWLIYSSCNPETLAKDLSAMPAFSTKQARMLDMFPHTPHSEVIVLLGRLS